MAKQRLMYGKDDLYVTDRSSPNATRVTDVQKWRTNQDDIRHLPGALPMQRLAIQDGAMSPSAAFVIVDTEGGAPADDLTAINPGDLHDGMELELISADSSRVVTIKNSTAFSGIRTIRGEDIVLGMSYSIRLKLISTESITYWQELPTAVKLSDSVTLEDSTIAASSLAAKTAYDRGSAGIAAADGLRQDVPGMAATAAGPSKKTIQISLTGTSTEYLAPEAGYISYRAEPQDNNAWISLAIDGTSLYDVARPITASSSIALNLPISKGQKAILNCASNVAFTSRTARFIYVNGNATA